MNAVRKTDPNQNALRQAGFTIIELMIATMVFSSVLILITYGVIQFNRAYYGGLVQTQTQNVARSIIDNLSQAVQLDGGTVTSNPNPGWSSICIDNVIYQFQRGMQLNTSGGTLAADQVAKALLVTGGINNCGSQTPGTVHADGTVGPVGSAGGTELLGEHMRIANLTVNRIGVTNLYTINVRVVYGDADELCSQTAGTCVNQNPSGATATDAQCRSTSADAPQFCAVADLTTTVQQRIN